MSKVIRRFGWVLLLAVAVLAAMAVPSPSSTTDAGVCYGTHTDYFQTSALLVCVGSKISCPGFPDQWDLPASGAPVTTPYFTTSQVVCPCPGSTPPPPPNPNYPGEDEP